MFLLVILLLVYLFSCVFLIAVILLQSGKGGGLSSLGAASSGISEALGATGAEKTLNKMTTFCACTFIILAILLSLVGSRAITSRNTLLTDPLASPATEQVTMPQTTVTPTDQTAIPEGTVDEQGNIAIPTDGGTVRIGDKTFSVNVGEPVPVDGASPASSAPSTPEVPASQP